MHWTRTFRSPDCWLGNPICRGEAQVKLLDSKSGKPEPERGRRSRRSFCRTGFADAIGAGGWQENGAIGESAGQVRGIELTPITRGGDGEAKFWLTPTVSLADSDGFDAKTLRELREVITTNKELIERAWNEHFT